MRRENLRVADVCGRWLERSLGSALGHVDLTIEADNCVPPRVKLGEAKIYDGPAYHVQGLDQLLRRYTTGRERRGLLISYVRLRDISGITSKLRAHMDELLPLSQKGRAGIQQSGALS